MFDIRTETLIFLISLLRINFQIFKQTFKLSNFTSRFHLKVANIPDESDGNPLYSQVLGTEEYIVLHYTLINICSNTSI